MIYANTEVVCTVLLCIVLYLDHRHVVVCLLKVSTSCAFLQHWPLAEQIHLCCLSVVGEVLKQRFQSTQCQPEPMLALD